MAQKLLVGDKDTVILIPAFEIDGVPQLAYSASPDPVPIDNTATAMAALLNHYIGIVNPDDTGSHWGGNVTCAIVDDWNVAMKDSSTKDVRTLCSVGQSQELTYYNYDAVMNFLRDLDPQDGTSEFNLAANLVDAPDVPYVIAHRVGYSRDTALTGTQTWHFYYVWTDWAILAFGDDDYQALGETFVSKGVVNWNAEVTA